MDREREREERWIVGMERSEEICVIFRFLIAAKNTPKKCVHFTFPVL